MIGRPKSRAQASDDSPLARAFAILNFVADQRKAVTAAEVAVGVGLPVATSHRLIGNLEVRGLLVRAPGTRRYVVGNALVLLAGRTIGSAFRTARRHAVLRAVAVEIGEQCEIGIVRDAAVSYVDSVRTVPFHGLQFDPGGGAPLHCSSTGKIYLGALLQKARERLVQALRLDRYTLKTICDAETLLVAAEDARATGWARTDEEYIAGVVGCAVPILAPEGTLLACLGVSVPAARVGFIELERFRVPLTAAAQRLSETILQAKED